MAGEYPNSPLLVQLCQGTVYPAKPLNVVWMFLLAAVLILVTAQFVNKDSEGSKSIYAIICTIMLVFWLVVASAFWSSFSPLMAKLSGEDEVKQ